MKYLIAAMLCLFSFASFGTAKPVSLRDEQHRATFTIVMSNATTQSRAGCSATAISEHVLLTAEHCDVKDGVLYLNQSRAPFQNPIEVTEKYYDHMDHMLLVTPNVSYRHTVEYDPDKYKPLTVGEHVYLWGNPALIKDQYREGYVSGTMRQGKEDRDEEIDAGGPITMFAMPIVGGDSGSAVFSQDDGRLVGVTTYQVVGKFLGTYPLQFTKQEVEQAEGHGNFVYIPETRPITKVTVNGPVVITPKPDNRLFKYLICVCVVAFVYFAVPFSKIFSYLKSLYKKVVRKLRYGNTTCSTCSKSLNTTGTTG